MKPLDSLLLCLLFAIGFLTAPLVGISTLMIFDHLSLSAGRENIVFGGSIVIYLVLYMGLWYRLKRDKVIIF